MFTIEQRGQEPAAIPGGDKPEALAGLAASAFGSAVSAAQRTPIREVTLTLYLGERELLRGSVPEPHAAGVIEATTKALRAALEGAPPRAAETKAAVAGK